MIISLWAKEPRTIVTDNEDSQQNKHMQHPKIRLEQYGPHKECHIVRMPKIDIIFSYQTPVAFYTDSTGLVTCENVWSKTTGKHLNWIDSGVGKPRLAPAVFNQELDDALTSVFLCSSHV